MFGTDDDLSWNEGDVRAGLIRVANNKQYFPNAHTKALLAAETYPGGLAWRLALVYVAENSDTEFIQSRDARIIVGMQAEDNSGPEVSKVAAADTAMLVDDSYIP